MKDVIFNVLHTHRNISKIQDTSINGVYSCKSYQYIYRFTYSIENIDISIVMGVPVDWGRKLIDIYIENYKEFKYIPHLENDGSICLFELEGVLIDKNFKGLL